MNGPASCLVLRLAGPLQSWGTRGQFNHRDTAGEPTKSGVVGLLAAAQGRRRTDAIDDLVGLRLGVRTDQPGSLLRDYHTVSDYRGRPLPSAAVNAKGQQKPTSPAKNTHVTHRFYLQDAVFVAAVGGDTAMLHTLAAALQLPTYALALGRRSCPPTHPLMIGDPDTPSELPLWPGNPLEVLRRVPWQASETHLDTRYRTTPRPAHVDLPVTVDDQDGNDLRMDLPRSFDPLHRGYDSRPVRQEWIQVRVPGGSDQPDPHDHDPFALLGW